MTFRALALNIVWIATACNGAQPSGEQRAEQMVSVAKTHLAVDDLKQTVGHPLANSRLKEVAYDSEAHGRFATYQLTTDGALKLFVVNQPDASPYVPIKDRAVFIERMMDITAPEAPKAERAWGARQLDSLWKYPARTLPVQVGNYVFKGNSGGYKGVHDTLIIVAADSVTTGLKYRPPR